MRTDRRADVTKLIVALRKFAKALTEDMLSTLHFACDQFDAFCLR
jgi:hypothetical protein